MSHTHVFVNSVSAIHLHPQHIAAFSVKYFFFFAFGDAFGVLLKVRAHCHIWITFLELFLIVDCELIIVTLKQASEKPSTRTITITIKGQISIYLEVCLSLHLSLECFLFLVRPNRSKQIATLWSSDLLEVSSRWGYLPCHCHLMLALEESAGFSSKCFEI